MTLYLRTWNLSVQETRRIFERWKSIKSFVALRTIALVFMSVDLLCFCISDLHDLKCFNQVQVFATFLALFMAWLQLHNDFAILCKELF